MTKTDDSLLRDLIKLGGLQKKLDKLSIHSLTSDADAQLKLIDQYIALHKKLNGRLDEVKKLGCSFEYLHRYHSLYVGESPNEPQAYITVI